MPGAADWDSQEWVAAYQGIDCRSLEVVNLPIRMGAAFPSNGVEACACPYAASLALVSK